jgi:hypothetical protein
MIGGTEPGSSGFLGGVSVREEQVGHCAPNDLHFVRGGGKDGTERYAEEMLAEVRRGYSLLRLPERRKWVFVLVKAAFSWMAYPFTKSRFLTVLRMTFILFVAGVKMERRGTQRKCSQRYAEATLCFGSRREGNRHAVPVKAPSGFEVSTKELDR